VIEQHPRLRLGAKRDGLAIDQHRIGKIYTVAELGRLAIDRDPTGRDPGFDFAARAKARGGERLL
jgi:hypothetical protein